MLKSCRALALISLLSLSVLIPVSAQEAVDCDAVTEIWQVQGSGDLSPCAGERVTLANNIVTAVAPLGFFMQTPSDRSDNDPATSDGLYVMTDFPPARIGMQAGDLVSVENGRVEEFYTRTQLNVTSMRRVIIESSGNPLPDAIAIVDCK
jgi:predicted extracellular nuclease